jgi:hypothetical protein
MKGWSSGSALTSRRAQGARLSFNYISAINPRSTSSTLRARGIFVSSKSRSGQSSRRPVLCSAADRRRLIYRRPSSRMTGHGLDSDNAIRSGLTPVVRPGGRGPGPNPPAAPQHHHICGFGSRVPSPGNGACRVVWTTFSLAPEDEGRHSPSLVTTTSR